MTTYYNFEIEDIDGEIFKRVDNTEAFINKFGVLHRRDIYTLKDINNNKTNNNYHIFKINNKTYYLEPTLKKLFPKIEYHFEMIDDKTIKINDDEFKRIYDTEAFINKNGLVFRKDKNEMTDIKNNKNHNIKINGKRYYLRKTTRDSFEIKPKRVKTQIKEIKEIK